MFHVLSRIATIIALLTVLISVGIDDDLFFIWICVAIFIKFFLLSDSFIKSSLGQTETQTYHIEQTSVSTNISETDTIQLDDTEELHNSSENKVTQELMEQEEDEALKSVVHDQAQYIASKAELTDASEPGIIEQFFAENLIAKIWGIIIFIAVLVFLVGIYAVIGPVTKIIIGFWIGFAIYGAGVVLDQKWYINESRIVLWVGILINYLVILSWRYLLWWSDWLLTWGITFLFLILNTVFGVVTSLVYQSRILLIFAFVFAYLNPLLLWESSSDPYNLVWYTMIVTLGAMYMAYTRKDEILFPLSFILASCMFLIAPWSDGNGWITKLLCINTLWAIGLYVSTVFKKQYQNIFEILIAGVFFMIGIMGILWISYLTSLQLGLIWISSLILMGLCYSQMNKWAYLYSIGTLWTVLTLTPVILFSGLDVENIAISICIILVFMIMNIWIVALKPWKFLSQNLWNIIWWLISGALFLSFNIHLFWSEYFPGIMQWFTYFGLATIYSWLSFFIVQSLGISELKQNEKHQNVFYTIAAIGISLFTLAVAYVFAESKEVVSIIWLLEANILFFLYHKTKSSKIIVAALVLFIIGILKFIDFIDVYSLWGRWFDGEYGMLVTLWVVAVSLILNLSFIFPKKEEENNLELAAYGIHNFFHILWMVAVALWIHEIWDFSSEWTSLLYFSTVTSFLGYIYSQFHSPTLQKTHLWAYIFLLIIHIGLFADNLWSDSINIAISTIIAGIYALPFIYEYLTRNTIQNKALFASYAFYIFVLSTLYILHIFSVTFAVTLYWWVLAFAFLSHGINKNILPMRTIGLYLLSLTVLKIFFYDLWQPGVDDGVGFLVFLATGILMIVLSTMYTKKYGNNLNKEFNLSNLFPENNRASHNKYISKNDDVLIWDVAQESIKIPANKSAIQKDIESVKINGISSIKLRFNKEEKSVNVRATNLIKIAKLIVWKYKKSEFQPWELQQAFSFIEKNYKSDLSPAQFTKIKQLVEKFVQQGWSIEFIKK